MSTNGASANHVEGSWEEDRSSAPQHQSDLEQIVARNPDGVVVMTKSGEISLRNPAAATLLAQVDDDTVRAFLRPAMTTDLLVEVTFEIGGTTVYAELRGADVTWHGVPARLVMIRDRTLEHVLAERALESQKMQAIGRVAGGVAHDFNNLLTVVIGYTDLLLRTDVDEATQDEMLHEILLAGERAKTLTGQLLTFSRNTTPHLELLNPLALVRDLQRMLNRVIGDHISLTIGTEQCDGNIEMDKGQLEQVILNLVVNARDAVSDGGTIVISCETVDVEGQSSGKIKQGQYVCIHVKDDGVGMSPAVIDHIFEPFYTTKAVGQGTGLGLATTYGIVKQHGGTITVKSSVGKGSTFSVYLPAARQQDETIPVDHDASDVDVSGSERILYVEDDDTVRTVTQLGLIDSGYKVTAVADPQEALNLVSRQGWHFDLVISDVSMPGMSGFAMVNQLREAVNEAVPAMFLTGFTPGDDLQMQNKNADPVLQKPFKYGEFLACVRNTLQEAHMSSHSAR